MTVIKVSFGALDQQQRALGVMGTGWDAGLDELTANLKTLRSSWTGEAREAFDRKIAEWERAAEGYRDVVRQVEDRIGTTHGNYAEANRVVNTMWGAQGATDQDFQIDVQDIAAVASSFAQLRLDLLGRLAHWMGELKDTKGMSGDDPLLNEWGARYDAAGKACRMAVWHVADFFRHMARKLVDTANAYLEAERSSGGEDVEPLQYPPSLAENPEIPQLPQATGGGPEGLGTGPEKYTPDMVREFWPNGWPERYQRAGSVWPQLAADYHQILVRAGDLLISLTENNGGAVFNAIHDFWEGLTLANSPEVLGESRSLLDRPAWMMRDRLGSDTRSLGLILQAIQAELKAELAAADAIEIGEMLARALDIAVTKGASDMMVKLLKLAFTGYFALNPPTPFQPPTQERLDAIDPHDVNKDRADPYGLHQRSVPGGRGPRRSRAQGDMGQRRRQARRLPRRRIRAVAPAPGAHPRPGAERAGHPAGQPGAVQQRVSGGVERAPHPGLRGERGP